MIKTAKDTPVHSASRKKLTAKKTKFSLFFVLSLLITSSSCFADLQADINKMISTVKPPVHIGIIVRQAATGKILYAHDDHYLFSPASIQKVLTATAALLTLKKDFRYPTSLLSNGKITNNVLNGDIALKFTGDPELTSDDIQQLMDALSEKGIKKINGNIYIDNSAYDQIYYPPGWLWDDLSYSYAAPLSAVNINKNKFVLHLVPAEKINNKPTLSTNLPDGIIHLKNYITTTAHYSKECPLTIYSDSQNNFTLHGCINRSEGRSHRSLSIRNITPYAIAIIQKALTDDGIQYTGNILVGHIDKKYKVMQTHYSVILQKLLKHMLKKSDNLISDSLMKQLVYQTMHHQATWSNGKMALEKILHASIGLDPHKLLIDDGAGMSRYNLLTPNQFSTVLDFIYRQPQPFRHVLIDALPIGGVDGTLVGRMYKEAAEKRIHAKTGSMTGVSTLAGYIYSRHLGALTFAIMVNGFIGKTHPYRQLEDKLCEYLTNAHG